MGLDASMGWAECTTAGKANKHRDAHHDIVSESNQLRVPRRTFLTLVRANLNVKTLNAAPAGPGPGAAAGPTGSLPLAVGVGVMLSAVPATSLAGAHVH